MYHELQVNRLYGIYFPLLKSHRLSSNLTNNVQNTTKCTFQRHGFLISLSLRYSCHRAWPLYAQIENSYFILLQILSQLSQFFLLKENLKKNKQVILTATKFYEALKNILWNLVTLSNFYYKGNFL